MRISSSKMVRVKTEDADAAVKESKVGKERKKNARSKHGSKATKEMRAMQSSTKYCIPLAAFRRVLSAHIDVCLSEMRARGETELTVDDIQLSKNMVMAMREDFESKYVDNMRRSTALAAHCKRKTIYGKDYQLAVKMKESNTFTFEAPLFPSRIKKEKAKQPSA